MKASRLFASIGFVALIILGVAAQHDDHTGADPDPSKSEKTYLVDEFGRLGDCELRARFDGFLAELQDRAINARGHVIFYKGADGLPGRYDEASHQKIFLSHLAFRNFDSSLITVVDGGFQVEKRTQLWIVPSGGAEPQPTETVEAPTIPKDKTLLFDERYIFPDYSPTEFERPEVTARRVEKEAEAEAEYQRELASEEASKVEAGEEAEPADEASENVPPEEDLVETRTPEEIEAEKFEWARVQFGEFLADRKEASGRIIFYADDQTYDIGRLRQFIEQGRDRIAASAKIAAGRISVEFGGYRGTVEVQFWIIPKKGEQPTPTPEERPVEEAEDPDDGSGQPLEKPTP